MGFARWYYFTFLTILLCLPLTLAEDISPGETAFATIVRNDNEVLLARVLLHTLKKHGSSSESQRRYIFAHSDVSTIAKAQILQDKDVILRPLPDERFTYMSLFNVTEVRRIVYLTPGTLIVDNISDLHRCGRFCAAFTSPCSFNTGVMVLSPDASTYSSILQTYNKLTRKSAICGGQRTPDGLAKEGCVLNEIFGKDLYDATLFNYEDAKTHGKDLSRLPLGCHVNHVLYYPRLRWEIPQSSCGKRRAIDFMGPSYFKPDKWWTYGLMDLGDVWAASRQELIDPTAPHSLAIRDICLRAVVSITGVLGVTFVLGSYKNTSSPRSETSYWNPFPKTDERLYILSAVSLILLGWLASLVFAFWATPSTLLPIWGAFLFCIYKGSFFALWNIILGATFLASYASDDDVSKPKYGLTLHRAAFETSAFAVFDVLFPLIGIRLVRRYVTSSIYARLLSLLLVVVPYFITVIVIAGRLSLVWLMYGAGCVRRSAIKARKAFHQNALSPERS